MSVSNCCGEIIHSTFTVSNHLEVWKLESDHGNIRENGKCVLAYGILTMCNVLM